MTHNANTSANAAIAANTNIVATLNGVVENKHITPTQAAAKAAEKAAAKEAEAQARKAAAERVKECNSKFDAATMGNVGDTFRTVEAHKDEIIHSDGTTVGSFMVENGLKKLTLKHLKAALHADFVRDGRICMPTWAPATVHAPEEDWDGAKVYYFVVKGDKRTWKVAQTPTWTPITLWTPAVLRRLLQAACKYDAAKRTKKAAEVKKCKHFYRLDERTEKAVNGKQNKSKTCVEKFVEVSIDLVQF